MLDQLRAGAKLLMSLGKRAWGIEDYPVRFRHNPNPELPPGVEWIPIAWHAQIINWWQMSGSGNTQSEAYEDLRRNLASYWSTHGYLPRPGTRVPLEFASSEGVERYQQIAREFFPPILGMDFDSCIITDESGLADFEFGKEEVDYVAKVKQVYGLDVSDIPGGNLVAIFRRIHASRRA